MLMSRMVASLHHLLTRNTVSTIHQQKDERAKLQTFFCFPRKVLVHSEKHAAIFEGLKISDHNAIASLYLFCAHKIY